MIVLQPESKPMALPLHYNHLVQAFIYNCLSSRLGNWLHEEGYRFGNRRFKLFHFSRLMAEEKRIQKGQIFFSGTVRLKIGAAGENVIHLLSLQLKRYPEIYLGNNRCFITQVSLEEIPKIKGKTIVRTLSPVTVYSTLFNSQGQRRTYFYSPFEPDFGCQIMANLKRKARAYLGPDCPLPSLNGHIRPIKRRLFKDKMICFKGTWIRAWDGLFELNLPEFYFRLVYDTGLGAKNSQGFGMIEMVTSR